MADSLITALLWVGAIGCGIMAGVYFTFSAFVMASLGKIAPEAGISAMQSINDVILRSAFMPLFFGTSLLAAGAIAFALMNWDRPEAGYLLAAGAIYVVGMFLCTVIFNVPLNNQLKAVDPGSAQGAEIWGMYLQVWTRWNHLRTVASTGACAFFFAAILRT